MDDNGVLVLTLREGVAFLKARIVYEEYPGRRNMFGVMGLMAYLLCWRYWLILQ